METLGSLCINHGLKGVGKSKLGLLAARDKIAENLAAERHFIYRNLTGFEQLPFRERADEILATMFKKVGIEQANDSCINVYGGATGLAYTSIKVDTRIHRNALIQNGPIVPLEFLYSDGKLLDQESYVDGAIEDLRDYNGKFSLGIVEVGGDVGQRFRELQDRATLSAEEFGPPDPELNPILRAKRSYDILIELAANLSEEVERRRLGLVLRKFTSCEGFYLEKGFYNFDSVRKLQIVYNDVYNLFQKYIESYDLDSSATGHTIFTQTDLVPGAEVLFEMPKTSKEELIELENEFTNRVARPIDKRWRPDFRPRNPKFFDNGCTFTYGCRKIKDRFEDSVSNILNSFLRGATEDIRITINQGVEGYEDSENRILDFFRRLFLGRIPSRDIVDTLQLQYIPEKMHSFPIQR